MQLLAVAKSQPAFTIIATIISGATDKQNVACADLLFTSQAFISAVNQAGCPEPALTSLILGHGYHAVHGSMSARCYVPR